MSSNVQSIICCLGDPVAGNPTQFLMQRAAASLGIDWMFVTAEVPESKIGEAFQGIRALRFSGVAFLPPHRLVGCTLVDSLTEAALRSGHVRVARRDGDVWLGDDTLGAAIVELLRSIASDSAIQSDRKDQGAILVCGRPYLAHLVRLASPPNWSERLKEFVGTYSTEHTKSEASSNIETIDLTPVGDLNKLESSASIPLVSFEDAAKNDLPIDVIVVDSTSPCMTQRQISKLKWGGNPCIIFIEANSRWENAIGASNIQNVHVFRPMDVAAAKALVSFHFWTGHHTDLASIRESLDEYCEW